MWLCVLIGVYGQQIKLVLDVDAYNNDIDIAPVISKINKLFPGNNVYNAEQGPSFLHILCRWRNWRGVTGVRNLIVRDLKFPDDAPKAEIKFNNENEDT
jgi:hypothetical protein